MPEPRRLFAEHLPPEGGEVRLGASAVHHARVLRLAEGDAVVLFDGCGGEAEGRVAAADEEGMVCRTGRRREVPQVDDARLVLVQSTPKAGKLDTIVRMATELGATAIRLVSTERTVGRPDPRRAAARMERLLRVAREAARQAGRATIPTLAAPAPLTDVVADAPEDAVRLVADPGARIPVSQAVGPGDRCVWIVVGPEGGLTDGERDVLGEHGFVPVCLGPHVLRVETAGPVAVALVAERILTRASRVDSMAADGEDVGPPRG